MTENYLAFCQQDDNKYDVFKWNTISLQEWEKIGIVYECNNDSSAPPPPSQPPGKSSIPCLNEQFLTAEQSEKYSGISLMTNLPPFMFFSSMRCNSQCDLT